VNPPERSNNDEQSGTGTEEKGLYGGCGEDGGSGDEGFTDNPDDKKGVGAFLPHYYAPYRGKDCSPQWKHSHAKQKPPSKQYGPMARRRRQIERGILTEANGLFCAR
jgi:hypothetical protein